MTKEKTHRPASLLQEELQELHQTTKLENQQIPPTESIESQNFFYPGSRVFKNRYGITDHKQLAEKFSHDVKQAMKELRNEAPPNRFDSSYLKYLHKQIFSNTFEWAGVTRDESFLCEDGSVVSMPTMTKENLTKSFATGQEIQQGLQKLDKMLMSNEDLQNLTREQFVEHATQVMAHLYSLHPFREGNRRTIQMFVEKLGQTAGHDLDYPLVSRKRENYAYAEMVNNDNTEPLRHLLEDISNSRKSLILDEFNTEMKKLGLKDSNYGLVVVAKDGHTYHGAFRGSGNDGFMMDANGILVLGDKADLSPSQLTKLTIGDKFFFTAPLPQDMQRVLIPGKMLPPLSQKEIIEKIQSNPSVQERRREIADLCKVVYGKSHILERTLREIESSPHTRNQVIENLHENLKSIAKLAGFEVCGVRNRARTLAENKIPNLEFDTACFANFVIGLERSILKSHFTEQKRVQESVEMPDQQLKSLFSLPQEQQRATLSTSPELKAQVQNYFKKFRNRLSAEERESIKKEEHKKLAESLDVPTNQAQTIAKLFKQTEASYKNIDPFHWSQALVGLNIKQPSEEESSSYREIGEGPSSRIHESSLGSRRKLSPMKKLGMQEKYDQEKKEDREVAECKTKSLKVQKRQKNLTF